MNGRILPVSEWPKLEAGAVLPYVEPHNAALAVVENEGEIIARVGCYQTSYFEGLWIDPRYRGNPGVFRALMREAFALPRLRGEQWALGGGTRETASIMEKLGKKMDCDFYAVGLREV